MSGHGFRNIGTIAALRLYALAAIAALSACIPAGVPTNSASSSSAGSPRLETDITGFVKGAQKATWQLREVTADAQDIARSTYTVRSGDTLRSIGNATGVGSEILAKINGLGPPFTIYPGQILEVPAGRYHLVDAGETGIAIARAYNIRWADVVALNDLEEPYILRIGQRLRLPDSLPDARPPSPVESDLEARAAAFDIGIDDIVTGGQPALGRNAQPRVTSTVARRPVNTAIAAPSAFNGRFAWPVNGAVLSSFGKKPGGVVNDGIDIAAKQGTAFLAAGDGVVAYAGDEIESLGGLVLIDHGDGWVSAYANAGRLDVVRGQRVRTGDRLGLTGDSGNAERPQLHFEVRKDRRPVDPLPYLPKR